MNRSMLVALALGTSLAGPSLAQTPPPDPAAEEAARRHAIVDGRDIQPRPAPGATDKSDPEVQRLLDQGKDTGPIVQPHDLYGNPIGGSPGLNPPTPVPPEPPKPDRPPGSP